MRIRKSDTTDYKKKTAVLLHQKKVGITCIVPAFNEGPRMGKVLDIIKENDLFKEIIIIDDGSSDDTLIVARNYAAGDRRIKIIKNKNNLGKTNSVINAVKESRGELIVLLDADLVGLDNKHISKMLYFILNGEFDMTILDRGGDRMAILGPLQSWVSRLIGGERAFWKKDFLRIKFTRRSSYALEQIMNIFYVTEGLKVRTVYCPDLFCTYQFTKKGKIRGLITYAKMFFEIYKLSEAKGYYLQVRDVVEDRIEPLYKFYEKTRFKKIAISAILVGGLGLSLASFLKLNAKKFAKYARR